MSGRGDDEATRAGRDAVRRDNYGAYAGMDDMPRESRVAKILNRPQFSAPVRVVCALCRSDLGALRFTAESVNDPSRLEPVVPDGNIRVSDGFVVGRCPKCRGSKRVRARALADVEADVSAVNKEAIAKARIGANPVHPRRRVVNL